MGPRQSDSLAGPEGSGVSPSSSWGRGEVWGERDTGKATGHEDTEAPMLSGSLKVT